MQGDVMSKKIDRIGEKRFNNFGSEMIIVRYKKAKNIDVYFPQYDWIAKNKTYQNFKNGQISCPYEKRYFMIGYLGEGVYKSRENGKDTRVYDTWINMMQRCYDSKYNEKYPTYKDCSISDEFHNFQNFGEWDNDNYYQIKGERMELDKDILVKHNKIYSPETCIYVPKTINLLFTKRQNDRGDNLIGTYLHKNDKYIAQCSLINPKTGKSKQEYLGYYDTEFEAFQVYKYHKEKNIKMVADYFKKQIPNELYDGLYRYEVEITD